MLSGTSVMNSETGVRTSVLTDDSSMIEIEKVVLSPALPSNRPATRSRGNVMDLPNVMRGPLEFKKYKLD